MLHGFVEIYPAGALPVSVSADELAPAAVGIIEAWSGELRRREKQNFAEVIKCVIRTIKANVGGK